MNTSTLLKLLLLVTLGSFLSTGCGGPERVADRQSRPAPVGQPVVVTEAPPAPLLDPVTFSPGPRYIWIRGGWVWSSRWVWEPGRWMRPPQPGAVWVVNHYEYRNGVHVFIRGGWRF